MATISATVKACGSGSTKKAGGKDGWMKYLRPSKLFGYTPYWFRTAVNAGEGAPAGYGMFGIAFINKATLVGSGGSAITPVDDTSTMVFSES